MDLMAMVMLWTVSGGLLIAGWTYLDRLDARARCREPSGRRTGPWVAAGRTGPRVDSEVRDVPPIPPDLGRTGVTTGPPLVDDEAGGTTTLRDWLVHFHPDHHNAWAEVTREFCEAMASHPDVSGYFAAGDRDVLQKHFLAALILITGHGVGADTLEQIRGQHADVRDDDGRGITPKAYDTAMRILLDILRARAIPRNTLAQLMIILYQVGRVVTTAPDSEPELRHERRAA